MNVFYVFFIDECIFPARWMKYLKNTINVESLNVSLFHDDNKGTKVSLVQNSHFTSPYMPQLARNRSI